MINAITNKLLQLNEEADYAGHTTKSDYHRTQSKRHNERILNGYKDMSRGKIAHHLDAIKDHEYASHLHSRASVSKNLQKIADDFSDRVKKWYGDI